MKEKRTTNINKCILKNRNLMVLILSFIIYHLSFSPTKAQVFIGYLSYDSALVSMPQYKIVMENMATLRQSYERELKSAEAEFNQKYEAFLEGRKDFPRTILLKRQTELQQLLERNVLFKEQGLRDLDQARTEALLPLRRQLEQAISEVASNYQLIVVVNTDANACPYLAADMAIDLNADVQQLLSK